MNKADGNFINPFFFRRIGEANLFIGSYPVYEMDVSRLYEAGVTAVLDIQNLSDTRQRGVNRDKLLQFYRNKGINVVINHPVNDVSFDDYCD